MPEVIFADGKTDKQVVNIAKAMHKKSKRFLVAKATRKIYDLLKIKGSVFHPLSGIISFGEEKRKKGHVLVLSAGTSDIPVAEEAAVTSVFLGSEVKTIYDVSITGLYRLFGNMQCIDSARVIIVAAGMEGALPSVVGGLTDKPIIAVPTSVSCGAGLGGFTALSPC